MDQLIAISKWVWAPIAGLLAFTGWFARREMARLDNHETRLDALERSRVATKEDLDHLADRLEKRIDEGHRVTQKRIDSIMNNCTMISHRLHD